MPSPPPCCNWPARHPGRSAAQALPVHHEEPAPGCRIYLMKRDPIAATSMAVTLRNFGYMVSQWHDFAASSRPWPTSCPMR